MIITGIDLLNVHATLGQREAALLTELMALALADRELVVQAATNANEKYNLQCTGYESLAAGASFETTLRHVVTETRKYLAGLHQAAQQKEAGVEDLLGNYDGTVQ